MKNIAHSIGFIVRLSLKCIFVFSFPVLFTCFGIYIVENLFTVSNPSANSMTYYGFATFAVLANILFSYARTYNNDQSEAILMRALGIRFLYSALAFLFGSMINYVIINLHKFYPTYKVPSPFTYVVNIAQLLASLLIIMAFFIVIEPIYTLMNHLFENMFVKMPKTKEKNYADTLK